MACKCSARLSARAPGLVSMPMELDWEAVSRPLELVLLPEARIEGKLERAWPLGNGIWVSDSSSVVRRVVTDTDGRFEVLGLPGGRACLTVENGLSRPEPGKRYEPAPRRSLYVDLIPGQTMQVTIP